ncbi:MAG: CHAP domain-containing protein, partial [Candidatus Moranbacteria bacterium]|nr:CHAP domain-containing protein [Candidatus Moranbacteria bacterium]
MFKTTRHFVFFMLCVTVSNAMAGWVWCTDYVASKYGIASYPNAKEWYGNVSLLRIGYTQSSSPAPGAIIVLNSWSGNEYGHVGTMEFVSQDWNIDHANWNNDGKINGLMLVESIDGWKKVRINGGKSEYPVRGFLIPPPHGHIPEVITRAYGGFHDLCINTYPNSWDSRCDTQEIANYLDCQDVAQGAYPCGSFGSGTSGDNNTTNQ